ncbi:MAG: tetratricopeptide repeat protein [Mariniblastus sp.]
MFDRHSESQTNVNRAEAASDARRYDVAQDMAMQAISTDPDNPDGYASLGRACLGQNKVSEAEEHFRKALSMDPESHWYLAGLSVCLRLQKKHKEALQHANELTRLFPVMSHSHETRGDALHANGKNEQAVEAYKVAIQHDPENDGALLGIGNALLDLKKPNEAESYIRRALEFNPNSAICLNNLGVCLENQGDLKNAALAYKSAVLVDPSLKIAKANTASAVDRYLAVGGGVSLFLIYIGFKIAYYFGRQMDSIPDTAIVISVVLVAVFFFVIVITAIYQRVVRKKRRKELESDDPQLLEIYNTIKRAKDY